MKIAYRRMSGAIGYTQFETGTRGLWLEKRVGLVALLRGRGHVVEYVNRMTKYSQLANPTVFGPKTHDLLIVEFGSSNTKFYGADLEETVRMVEEHSGRIVFVNDDPDLPYLWKRVANPSRWSVWMNATRPEGFGGQPERVRSYDFPFSALLPYRQPLGAVRPVLSYIGRPVGRKAAVQVALRSGVEVEWVGRPGDWKGFAVSLMGQPAQAERAAYYAGVMGCLGLSDAKHKRLGWRTGRVYHALHAGTPALVERGTLRGFAEYGTAEELVERVADLKEPGRRLSVWKEQRASEEGDLRIVDQVLLEHGL